MTIRIVSCELNVLLFKSISSSVCIIRVLDSCLKLVEVHILSLDDSFGWSLSSLVNAAVIPMTGNEYNLWTVRGLGWYWDPRCYFDLGVILAVIENKFDSPYSKTNSKQNLVIRILSLILTELKK